MVAQPPERSSIVFWNPQLGLRFGADMASAAAASALVSPVVSLVDRSIVTKTATGNSIASCFWTSLKPIVTAPHKFLASRTFSLLFAVYFGTYTTANCIDTVYASIHSQPASTISTSLPKFLGTSAVSTGLCVYKDACFARMFGANTAPGASVPRLSYLLFTFRDAVTIYGCFILPPLLAPKLAELPPVFRRKFSRILSTESARYKTAQFILPATIQFVSTPIHLLGLDLHNRQQFLPLSQRLARVNRDMWVSIPVRIMRILPAFGVGGVVNLSVRKTLMDKLELGAQDSDAS